MALNFSLLVVVYLVFASDYMAFSYGDIFGYGDELLPLFLFCAAVLALLKKSSSLSNKEIVIAWVLLVVISLGALSSLVYRYQPFIPSFVDSLVFIKAFVAYFSARIAFGDSDIFAKRDFALKIFRSLTIILLLTVLVDQVVDFFPKQGSFFLGFNESELWFVHSSRLAFTCSMLFCATFAFSKRNDSKIWALLALLAGLFTFKQKFISFSLIAIFVLYWELNIKKIGSKAVFFILVLIGCAALLSLDKINFYFSDESYISGFARAVLTRVSFFVADDHFPLGAGFGTFGTHVSGVEYSELYSVYGIDNVFGLTRDEPMFVSDVYWPMVLAQFGYFGVALMVFVFVLLATEFVHFFNESNDFQLRRLSLSMLFILWALLVDTTADQIISQNRGVVAMFLIALLVNARNRLVRS